MNLEDQCNPGDIARLLEAGEPEALDRIARCYLDDLLGVGRCACGDRQSAEDAVQDALVAAASKMEQFRAEGSVRAWLSKMVVNACRVRRRGRKNDPAWNLPLDDCPADRPELGAAPDHCAARTELQQILHTALGELSLKDRALFLEAELEGSTGPQLGARYNLSPEAVRARLSRTRRRLREALGELWKDWDA